MLPAQEKRCTYADMLEWDDTVRYELYDGEPVALASPSRTHQRISMDLSRQLSTYLLGKSCEVYHAPFDVRLFEQEGDPPENVDDVVQPDIFVVCDKSKIDERGCKGAPDLVIEILSPSTQLLDRTKKYWMYQKAGVKEYWVVNPWQRVVSVHTLEEGYASPVVYSANAEIPVGVLENCTIDLTTVFP